MNLPQFIISMVLAIALAGLTLWNSMAAQANGALATEQAKLQSVIATARAQQNVLEQLVQRTAVLGQNDPDLMALLAKYGVSVKPANQEVK